MAPKATASPKTTAIVFPRELCRFLRHFPDILDRSRHVSWALVPMNVIPQIAQARELIHQHEAWADAHPDEDVPLSDELWELVKDWPPLLERCRNTPGIPFAPIEVEGIVLTRTLWPEVEE